MSKVGHAKFWGDSGIIKKLKPVNFSNIKIGKYSNQRLQENPTTTADYMVTDIIMLELNDETPSKSIFYSLNYRLNESNNLTWFMYKGDGVGEFADSERIENILGRLGQNHIPCVFTYKYNDYIRPIDTNIVKINVE
jgi:hypothetical protein